MSMYIKPNCEIVKMNAENEMMAASMGFKDEVGGQEQLSPMLPYETPDDGGENISR